MVDRVVMLFATVALVAPALTGCATGAPPADLARPLTITGQLAYRERIALPPDSVAIVELRDAAAPEGASVVAEQRIELRGRQPPVPFELRVDRSRLDPGRAYAVRGGVIVGRLPAWASDAAAVDATRGGPIDVGTLWMQRVQWLAFASTFRCGDREVRLGIADGQRLRMTVGGEAFDMQEVRVASGSKVEAVGDPSTFLWSKGDVATLQVRGAAMPACVRTDVAPR
ncbi:MAG: YbaY family lipoprotein [Burkholderiaceae bacterium]|nr:YbaY family lipoprotein [Burkholderiaceae bacterium]